MKVKDLMTTGVAFVNPTTTITDAAKLMQQQNIGSIPVCDQSGVVGIVTDRDIVVRNVASGQNPQQTWVKDVMTTNITTVSSNTDVGEVSRLMSQGQIRRIPVVDNNMLVGIVSLGDIAADALHDTEVASTLTEISRPLK